MNKEEEIQNKINNWIQEYHEYKRENPNKNLLTFKGALNNQDEIDYWNKVKLPTVNSIKKKTEQHNVHSLKDEFDDIRKEILRKNSKISCSRIKEEDKDELREEIILLEGRQKSILELIEAHDYKYTGGRFKYQRTDRDPPELPPSKRFTTEYDW